jgi:hypothetical protein
MKVDDAEKLVGGVQEIVRLAEADLAASRSLVERLLSTRDALRATAITIAVALMGFTITNREPMISFIGIPMVFLLGLGEVRQHLLFRNTSRNEAQLERLLDAYANLLKESAESEGVDDALETLVRRRDALRLGLRKALRGPNRDRRSAALRQYWFATFGRFEWYLFVLIALMLGGVGTTVELTNDAHARTCLTIGQTVVEVEGAQVIRGGVPVGPCEDHAK